MMRYIAVIILGITLFACSKKNQDAKLSISKADEVLLECIEAHGGKKYDTASYAFIFRNNTFQFYNERDSFVYVAESMNEGDKIVDRLDNTGFTRKVNDKAIELSTKDSLKYLEGINSVIYFATLPYKLQDNAVKSAYKGTKIIGNENYEVIQISFDEEGGGQDHDDVFYYWINEKTKLIDFLAYKYSVNKGGVRFREAYNTRNVDGIVFQDYINYKAEVGTSLEDLPDLWKSNELIELSRIETEKVKVL